MRYEPSMGGWLRRYGEGPTGSHAELQARTSNSLKSGGCEGKEKDGRGARGGAIEREGSSGREVGVLGDG